MPARPLNPTANTYQHPTSSASSSNSESPSPSRSDEANSSRINLPPSTLPGAEDGAIYEGENPTILADLLLKPSLAVQRPGLGTRNSSWREILTNSKPPSPAPPASEGSDLASTGGADGAGGGAEDRAVPAAASQRKRRDRSESAHKRREELPWWKRPSPVWFIPGTIAISLSMGMTISAKLELYNQLVCRSMDPLQSGVTVPPPMTVSKPEPWHPSPIPRTSPSDSFSDSLVSFEYTPPDGEITEEEEGKEWTKQCHKSKAVSSEVARLALILSLTMGILSSLTGGFWGAYSDRKGRKPVLILALLGTVLMDAVFIATVKYHSILSYNFLLVGPICDGLLGGYSTAQATTSAYLSDVTPSGSRARIFSLLGGLMFLGIGVGPILGSVLITITNGNALSPFYVSLGLHVAYLLLAALVMPESLEKSRRENAKIRYEEEKEKEKQRRKEKHEGWVSYLGELALRPFGFLTPVALVLPRVVDHSKRQGGEAGEDDDEEGKTNIEWGAGLEEYAHPEEVWRREKDGAEGGGATRRDWTLTKIAMGWFSYMLIVAVMSTKLLYANFTFGWTPQQSGYFLSYIGFLRVFTLVLVLPFFIKRVLGRKAAPLPHWPRPVLAGVEDEQGTSEAVREKVRRWERERKWLRVVHDSHFDLRLALSSLFIDFVAFGLYTLSPLLGSRTPASHLSLFLLSAFLQSLGSGATPALQSLALAHASPRDAGKLFASLSVLQSLASQVIGPLIFGVTFMRTVGRWSEAVFALATLLAAISLGALSLVRLRRVWVQPGEGGELGEEGEQPKRTEEQEALLSGRGRSTTRRDSRAGSSGFSLRTEE